MRALLHTSRVAHLAVVVIALDNDIVGHQSPERSMASSANTFGTFLDTFKRLEEAPSSRESGSFPESEVLQIAKTLAGSGGQLPLRAAMGQAGLADTVFFRAVLAGRDKGIFDIDETSNQAVLKLSKLGYGFAG
jgi:hypothetical protein